MLKRSSIFSAMNIKLNPFKYLKSIINFYKTDPLGPIVILVSIGFFILIIFLINELILQQNFELAIILFIFGVFLFGVALGKSAVYTEYKNKQRKL